MSGDGGMGEEGKLLMDQHRDDMPMYCTAVEWSAWHAFALGDASLGVAWESQLKALADYRAFGDEVIPGNQTWLLCQHTAVI